jgi:hypothetical protein
LAIDVSNDGDNMIITPPTNKAPNPDDLLLIAMSVTDTRQWYYEKEVSDLIDQATKAIEK